MGYFDALTSGYFRTTEDGRRLFFPWGPIGRGYVVGTPEQFRRLRRRIRSYYVVSLPLTIGAVVFAGLLGGAVILPVVIVPYAIWVRIQCRDLAVADERLTFTESRINQAREFNKAVPINGLVITKLDGTSKGGMVVAIQKELGLPIKFVGLGEQPDDLQPFDPKEFAQALFTE